MATSIGSTELVQPREGVQQRASDRITAFCGTMTFVYVHAAAFAIWIATKGFGQDAFPYNFLTMAVSLEAIFLSTFVLISQNRQAAVAEKHNDEIQRRQLQLLGDVIDDEKLDLKNEEMISVLLNRIDVEHIKPMADAINRIEVALSSEVSGDLPTDIAVGGVGNGRGHQTDGGTLR